MPHWCSVIVMWFELFQAKLNPGHARVNFLAWLFSILLIRIIRFFAEIAVPAWADGVFGGPVSWGAALAILVVTVRVFWKYITESKLAKGLLDQKVLPCPNCGYPLGADSGYRCSECGGLWMRSEAVEYWKNRQLISSGLTHDDEWA